MTYAEFIVLLTKILAAGRAQALALSKGGWEGWLQCELWNLIADAGTEIEREVRYPGANTYCDLVFRSATGMQWVEIKAFGAFREVDINAFLDSYALDVQKLASAPQGVDKLAILVVPKNVGEKITQAIVKRWSGVERISERTMDVFLVRFR